MILGNDITWKVGAEIGSMILHISSHRRDHQDSGRHKDSAHGQSSMPVSVGLFRVVHKFPTCNSYATTAGHNRFGDVLCYQGLIPLHVGFDLTLKGLAPARIGLSHCEEQISLKRVLSHRVNDRLCSHNADTAG